MSDKKNYQHQEGIDKLRELVMDTDFCMFCTALTSLPIDATPMSTQQVDDQGNIWFFSSRDSDRNRAIKEDGRTQLMYSNPGNQSYVSVYGKSEIVHDPAKVEELWSTMVKAWFPEGKDDPNLSLIKFSAQEAYYWDTKNGKMISFLKMLASIATGTESDGGVQGKITV